MTSQSILNSKSRMRVGVIGLGKMGLLHAAIFNTLPESHVTAAVEPQKLVRDSLSKYNSSIRTFPQMDAMLTECGLDAVVIATPVGEHVSAALTCVQHNIPFLVEKPLATSAQQAEALIQAIHQNPVVNMVGFMMRFVGSFQKGKEIIDSGCLGDIHRVTGTTYVSQLFTRGWGWRYDRKAAGGGVLLSQGSHLIDLLTWYFGPVERVNARMLSVYSADIEDFSHLMLEFRSGLHGWIDSSWSVRFHRTLETTIEVLGANGALTIGDDVINLYLDRPATDWPAGRTMLHAADLYRGVPVDVAGPQYTLQDQAFIQSIGAREHLQSDVMQAFHVQQIVDAAYQSSVTNCSTQEVAG